MAAPKKKAARKSRIRKHKEKEDEPRICKWYMMTFGQFYDEEWLGKRDEATCKNCSKSSKYLRDCDPIWFCDKCSKYICHICYSGGKKFLLPADDDAMICGN